MMNHTKSQPSLKGHARPHIYSNSQATAPKISGRKQMTSVKYPLLKQTVLTFSNNATTEKPFHFHWKLPMELIGHMI